MTRTLKAIAVVVGVVGAVVIAVVMLLGPLIADPPPNALERFTIFAYPICMLLGGIFAVLRIRIALIYGLLAIGFAIAFAVIYLLGDHNLGSVGEKVIFVMFVVGPALILSSLCWSVMRSEAQPAIPTRLG